MIRALYQLILGMHPAAFRHRYSGEMLSIFDEATARTFRFILLQDVVISLFRQWFLRTGAWKIILAIGGAFIQVISFGLPMKGHQHWKENNQAFTPHMQELVFITLALLCGLFMLVMFLVFLTVQFQRNRLTYRSPAWLRARK